MSSQHRNFIDGDWVESNSGETFENRNPADTKEVIGEYQQSTAEDAEAAIEAANEAADEWAAMPGGGGRILRKAGEILTDRKEELTQTLSHEVGKTTSEAGGEVQRSIDIYAYYAAKASDFGGPSRSPRARLPTSTPRASRWASPASSRRGTSRSPSRRGRWRRRSRRGTPSSSNPRRSHRESSASSWRHWRTRESLTES